MRYLLTTLLALTLNLSATTTPANDMVEHSLVTGAVLTMDITLETILFDKGGLDHFVQIAEVLAFEEGVAAGHSITLVGLPDGHYRFEMSPTIVGVRQNSLPNPSDMAEEGDGAVHHMLPPDDEGVYQECELWHTSYQGTQCVLGNIGSIVIYGDSCQHYWRCVVYNAQMQQIGVYYQLQSSCC